MQSTPVSRREWYAVGYYTLFLLAITTIPYVLAALSSNDEWVFNGFLFGVEDGNAYLGKMQLGVMGEWSFHLFYSPNAADEACFMYLPYIIAGHIIRLLIDETDPDIRFMALMVGFHTLRVIFDVLLIVCLYRFIAHFLNTSSARFMALILATLGGGLGWLLALAGYSEWLGSPPPDVYIPEAFGLLVIFGLPHIALARAALLLGFLLLFKAIQQPLQQTWHWSVLAGVCWLVVGIGVAFYLVIIYCIVVAWGLTVLIKRRRIPWTMIGHVTTAVALTWPMVGYFVAVFNLNDNFAAWSAQNLLPAPHPIQYVLAYIFFLPATWGAWWLWKWRSSQDVLLLLGWVLAVPILVYIPINVQRRLAEAVIVPLSILCVVGIELAVKQTAKHSYMRRWRQYRRWLLIPATLTSILLLLVSSLSPLSPDRPVFRPADEFRAMDYLTTIAPTNSVVLTARTTGNVMAVRSGLKLQVYLGHGPETVDSDRKIDEVEAFFGDEMTDAEIEILLRDGDIDYIFYGETERDYAQSDVPLWANGLQSVYNRDGYIIYEVSP